MTAQIDRESLPNSGKLTHKQLDTMTSIIEQIDSANYIVAFNNDKTPFSVVYYILKTIVPFSDQRAYDKTIEIHDQGKATVYTGDIEHCYKIADSLAMIDVEFEIF